MHQATLSSQGSGRTIAPSVPSGSVRQDFSSPPTFGNKPSALSLGIFGFVAGGGAAIRLAAKRSIRKGKGPALAGKPTIYVQTPDGTVQHRQDDYAGGAQGLRPAFERLRKPDKNYRPDKDRDLRRPVDGLLSRLIDVLARPFRVLLRGFGPRAWWSF